MRDAARAAMVRGRLGQSEWPPSLLLDEVWLRVRRVTVRRLEADGFWSRTDRHRAFMEDQRQSGEQLTEGLLRRTLGQVDYAEMQAETAFGRGNRRLRRRLPFVLAFGFELGTGLYRTLGVRKGKCGHTGQLCALFNLG